MTPHLLLLACLALTSGLELQVMKRYPTADLEKRRDGWGHTAWTSITGKLSNADTVYNKDNQEILNNAGLKNVALTGGESGTVRSIEYSDGGAKSANFYVTEAKSTQTMSALFTGIKLLVGAEKKPYNGKLAVPLYWHEDCGKPQGKSFTVGANPGTGVPSNCDLKFGFVNDDKGAGDLVFLVVLPKTLTNIYQKRFHTMWLTAAVQKIASDGAATAAGIGLGFLLAEAGPAGVVVGAVLGTAAGNKLGAAMDKIVGQQLRFIAHGPVASKALEISDDDGKDQDAERSDMDVDSSIEELDAHLKALEAE